MVFPFKNRNKSTTGSGNNTISGNTKDIFTTYFVAKNRETIDMLLVVGLSIALSLIALIVHCIGPIYDYFVNNVGAIAIHFFMNLLMLYLLGLLWFSYRYFKRSRKKRKELEDFLTSIHPDALIVVNEHDKVIMCSKAVESIFGFDTSEIVGKNINRLIFNNTDTQESTAPLYSILKNDRLDVGIFTVYTNIGEEIQIEAAIRTFQNGGRVILCRKVGMGDILASYSLPADPMASKYMFHAVDKDCLIVDEKGSISRIDRTLLSVFDIDELRASNGKCHKIFDCSMGDRLHCSFRYDGKSRTQILKTKPRSTPPCILKISPTSQTYQKMITIIKDFKDVIEGRQVDEKTFIDEITGLYNRRGFFTFAEKRLEKAVNEQKSLVVFFADIEGLKSINQQYGHNAGNEALAEAAGVLKHVLLGSDIVGRISGDEFAIVISNMGEKGAQDIIDRLQKSIQLWNSKKDRKYFLSFSVGYGVLDPMVPVGLDDLLKKADKMLYKHKRGRQRVK